MKTAIWRKYLLSLVDLLRIAVCPIPLYYLSNTHMNNIFRSNSFLTLFGYFFLSEMLHSLWLSLHSNTLMRRQYFLLIGTGIKNALTDPISVQLIVNCGRRRRLVRNCAIGQQLITHIIVIKIKYYSYLYTFNYTSSHTRFILLFSYIEISVISRMIMQRRYYFVVVTLRFPITFTV